MVVFAIFIWFCVFLISLFFWLEIFQVTIIWGSYFNSRHGRQRYFCGPWSAFQKNHQTTGKVLHSVLLSRTSIIYVHYSYFYYFIFLKVFFLFFDIVLARSLFWHGWHVFYEPWFAFQKESPNDCDGFTFCTF